MRENWRFTDEEAAWIVDKFHNDPEVRRKMDDRTASNAVLDAAVYLGELFQDEFTTPYRGETEKEFAARRRNISDKKTRDKAKPIPPETQKHFEERMAALPERIKKKLYSLRHEQKRNRSLPPLPALPPAKRFCTVTGFDVFQGSPEAPKAPSVTGERHAVGSERHLASVRWKEMTDEEKAPYIAQALEENKSRQEERDASAAPEGSDHRHPAYTANEIATWAMAAMKTVDDKFKWAGAVVLAGPDEQGEIMTYIQHIGHNRHGETLVDSVYKNTGIDENELKALALTFAEQARQGPLMAPEDLAHNVAARVLADVRSKKPGKAPTTPDVTSSQLATSTPTPEPSQALPVSTAASALPDAIDSDGVGINFNDLTPFSPEPQGTPKEGGLVAADEQLAQTVEHNSTTTSPSHAAPAAKNAVCRAALGQQVLDADEDLAHGERFTHVDTQLVQALQNIGALPDLPMPDLETDPQQDAPAASSAKRLSPEQPVRTKTTTKRVRRVAQTAGVVMPPEDASYVLASHRESRTVRPTLKAAAIAENAQAKAQEKENARARKAAGKKGKKAPKKK